MVQLNKIYTRTGDQGKTSLVSGERVSKHDLRIEVSGVIDELNSQLGVLRTYAEQSENEEVREGSRDSLREIQNDLFDVGSLVAAAPGSEFAASASLREGAADGLETRLDAFNRDLPELTSFVLPGGCDLNAQAHVVRAVCRRAERRLWQLHEQDAGSQDAGAEATRDAHVLRYMNRLSDLLFVYARWVSRRLGLPEYLWVPSLQRED